MILDYKFRNWLSFNNEVSFSMMATRERDPYERLATDNNFTGRVLPISAIYGYNASGKTNFIESLAFLQSLVIDSSGIFGLQPFIFVSPSDIPHSEFSIKFLTKGKVYLYSVKLKINKILYEKLSLVTKTTESILFERKGQTLHLNQGKYDEDSEKRLKIIMQGTAQTQTFLNNSVSQQVDFFKEAFEWFLHKLVVVNSHISNYSPKVFMNSLDYFNEILKKLDIQNNLYVKKNVAPMSLGLPSQFIKNLNIQMSNGETKSLFPSVSVTKLNDQLQFYSVSVRHKNLDNPDITTDLDQSAESEGVRRLYELGPVLKDLLLANSEYTFVIDELDKSLHPLLVRHIIELFNERCNRDVRRQLIFSCHDSSLMDQTLMRRDAYWIITKNYYGESFMQRVTNLKQGKRTDKSIRNAYMAGELGVTPEFLKNI